MGVKTRCIAPTRKTTTRSSPRSKASRARTTVSAKCRSPAVTNALGEIRRKRTVLGNNRSESFLYYDHTCFFSLGAVVCLIYFLLLFQLPDLSHLVEQILE